MPKYQKISKLLRDKIIVGYYPPESCLPGCRELADEYGVSYVTATNAIKHLAAEGLVEPIRGRGVFVRTPSPTNKNTTKSSAQVGVLLPTGGDLFHDFFSAFLETLELFPRFKAVALSNKVPTDNWTNLERREQISRHLGAGYKALIIDGTRHFDFKTLHEFSDSMPALTFVMHFESELDFPNANVIIPDYERAGYLAAEYLLERGVEQLIVLSFEELDEMKRRSNGSRLDCYDYRILDGIENKLTANGLNIAEKCLILRSPADSTAIDESVINLMRKKRCGFIAVGDQRAVQLYQIPTASALLPGRDFYAVGLYNTSWADKLQPGLTSISIDEEKIGQLAAKSAIEDWHGRKITIEPQIILRSS